MNTWIDEEENKDTQIVACRPDLLAVNINYLLVDGKKDENRTGV